MSGTFRVLPDSIEFKDLSVNESDSIDVSVTNISRKTLHIRFSLSNPLFTLNNISDITLTPGLSMSKEIS